MGVETLAAGLSEPRDTIEDVIEPYLIQLGLIARTARGRCLNGRGYAHLGLPAAAGQPGRPVRSWRVTEIMRVLALIMAAALSAAPGTVHAQAARTHPAAVNYAADNNWLCLPGRERRLLDAAPDNGAESERLRFDRPQHRRERSAGRLLLRLPDGLAATAA